MHQKDKSGQYLISQVKSPDNRNIQKQRRIKWFFFYYYLFVVDFLRVLSGSVALKIALRVSRRGPTNLI